MVIQMQKRLKKKLYMRIQIELRTKPMTKVTQVLSIIVAVIQVQTITVL